MERLPRALIGKGDPGLDVPFPATTRQALEWLEVKLRKHAVEEVYDSLLEALALNMLHYDTTYGVAYDQPVAEYISWLDFTHGLTFANAVRVLATRHPELWPTGLAQMACFLGRNHPFILQADALESEEWKVDDPNAFFEDIRERLLDHGLCDPIFPAHLLKTSLAVEAELPHASESTHGALLASLNRSLSSPLKTKHVRRLARQAITLVARDF